MKKVLLISMPFGTIKFPAVGISLLKPKLQAEGIPCDVKYLNIDFARMIGPEVHEEIGNLHSEKALVGESLFAQAYDEGQLPPMEEYLRFISSFLGVQNFPPEKLRTIKDRILPFLNHCLEEIDWEPYGVVGFSSVFEQNLASLSLARRIKERYPEKILVFGGANCDGEMGLELHRSFPFIDYVCSGEADFTFPELLKRVFRDEDGGEIPGLIYRQKGESVKAPGIPLVYDLDGLPAPDYDDYFTQLEQASFPRSLCAGLPMEASRGCWWGQKSQCNFCSLNPETIHFRSKSKDRILSELKSLAQKYSDPNVFMVDNILDMKFFKDLLPELKQMRLPVQIFFETKANLNREQVQMLKEAGITWIQPGVENLSTHILKLMAKGVSALQNVQLLKYCKQFEIHPTWNILTHFPGEKSEDYQEMLGLMDKLTHLPPPYTFAHFTLQRGSPYFLNPEKYGISNVRPEEIYRFIYPGSGSARERLAFYFQFDFREGLAPANFDKELAEAIEFWKGCYGKDENLSSQELSPSSILIRDGRSNARVRQVVLSSIQKTIYEYCDQIRLFSSVLTHVRGVYRHQGIRARDLRDVLGEMVALNLMATEDDKYLSLAIRLPRQPAWEYRHKGAEGYL